MSNQEPNLDELIENFNKQVKKIMNKLTTTKPKGRYQREGYPIYVRPFGLDVMQLIKNHETRLKQLEEDPR